MPILNGDIQVIKFQLLSQK